MKRKLYIVFALLLPTLTAAAEKIVRVPNPCFAGQPFTIKIPVRFPDSMTVQYAWYRNDTLIEDSHMLLLGESKISYTIPASKAYGSAVYHFKYMLHDDYHEWTASPKYVLTFASNGTISCALEPGSITDGDIRCALLPGSITDGDIRCALEPGSITDGDIRCALEPGSITDGDIRCALEPGSITDGDIRCALEPGSITDGDVRCELEPGTISE